MSKQKRRLVIDADIARSAGGPIAISKHGKTCRDLLSEVKINSYRIVFNETLSAEWKDHAGRFALSWLTQMTKRGKRVQIKDSCPDDVLCTGLCEAADHKKQQSAISKDFHLVHAAKSTDWAIISCDDQIRSILADNVYAKSTLSHLDWVNPARSEDQAVAWLQSGALQRRKLCN
jgi:hypothetical protein